jgi:hypothetical protein
VCRAHSARARVAGEGASWYFRGRERTEDIQDLFAGGLAAGEAGWGAVEIRMIRITGIVWVPVVGLSAVAFIKWLTYAVMCVVVAGFGWVLRVLFH